MPTRELREELQRLREQLDQQPPLDTAQRAELETLIEQIQLQLTHEEALADESLVDSLNLAVERFEASHPTMAGTLRSIVQSLANMGI
ncbi:MAG: hypothetical protein GAK43_02681 [Stenotrophomonas maltophilia]|nr:MAG: hypothetical protein GAK43_02681 [Stenotrophomonas maltophilia]